MIYSHLDKPESQEQLISKICDEVKELLIKKNRDYSNSFSKQFEKYGVLSGLIRMDDKMSRLTNLVNGAKQEVTDEGIIDSIRDLAGYCCLTLVELSKIEKI